MSPFPVPLGIFAMVVLIVAIAAVARISDVEVDVHQTLHGAEMEHQRKMRELEMEIERIKQGSLCDNATRGGKSGRYHQA